MGSELRDRIKRSDLISLLRQSKRTIAGRVAIDANIIDDLSLILMDTESLPGVTSHDDRYRLCKDAAIAAAHVDQIDEKGLGTELGRRCSEHASKPIQRFVYVTSLFEAPPGVTRRIVRGCSIRFVRDLPRRYDRSFVDTLPEYTRTHAAHKGSWLLVSVRTRTHFEAAEEAREAIDLLRGVWNLAINETIWNEIGGDQFVPLNKIRSGPIGTVHLPSGQPAVHMTWYDPFFKQAPDWPPLSSSMWKRVMISERPTFVSLRRGSLGASLKGLLVRYCRACDHPDPERAFLALWSLLEALTETTSDRYVETIRRAAGLFLDSDVAKLSLEWLRFQRNRVVHSGATLPEPRQAACMANRFVCTCLDLGLRTTWLFKDAQELGTFLTLPADEGRLKRMIELHRRAIFFRRKPQQLGIPAGVT